MREIPLTRGKVAIVDDEDYDWLIQWNWCARPVRWKDSPNITWYACRRIRKGEREKRVGNIGMHTLILGLGPRESCDHKDRNGLNNQRENLRPCDETGNNGNRALPRNNTTGLKGVRRHRDKFQATLVVHNKPRHLGTFDTPREAAVAYDNAASQYFGEFARTNTMLGLL